MFAQPLEIGTHIKKPIEKYEKEYFPIGFVRGRKEKKKMRQKRTDLMRISTDVTGIAVEDNHNRPSCLSIENFLISEKEHGKTKVRQRQDKSFSPSDMS